MAEIIYAEFDVHRIARAKYQAKKKESDPPWDDLFAHQQESWRTEARNEVYHGVYLKGGVVFSPVLNTKDDKYDN